MQVEVEVSATGAEAELMTGAEKELKTEAADAVLDLRPGQSVTSGPQEVIVAVSVTEMVEVAETPATARPRPPNALKPARKVEVRILS